MPLGECFRIKECVQPTFNVKTCMELPNVEDFVKEHPPSSEVKEETINTSNNMVGKANDKKKKKNKKRAWPPLPTTMKSILKDFKTYFGGENHDESSSLDNGKKVCFAPP